MTSTNISPALLRISDYSLFFNAYQDLLGKKTPAFVLNRAIRSPQAGVFLGYAVRLANALTVTPGGRVDYYEYNDEVKFFPRADHLGLFFNHLPTESTKLTCGRYGKKIPGLPDGRDAARFVPVR